MAKTPIAKSVSGLAYSEDDIEHVENLEAVRKKPTIYIGPTDSDGFFVIHKEILDNIDDEYGAGRATTATFIDDGKYFWGIDDGEGIPVGTHKKAKISTLELLTSKLHASGKFGSAAYAASRGTHGIGIKATNALSQHFVVYTCRDKVWYSIEFKNAKMVSPVKKCAAPTLPSIKGVKLDKPTKGTIIKYMPDMSFFAKNTKLNYKDLFSWAQLASYFSAGFKVRVIKVDNGVGKEKLFYSKKGIAEYLDKKTEGVQIAGKLFQFQNKEIDAAVYFTNADGTNVEAYTNGLRNKEGGFHVRSMLDAINKAITPYKKKGQKFTPSDLQEGIIGVINVKISTPKFNNQPKDKLVDERVPDLCDDVLEKAFKDFFSSNKTLALNLCKRAVDMRKLKDEFSESKKALREMTQATRGEEFHRKHIIVPDASPDKREIFLVEGESAEGTAKFARDKTYQEVFSLKGKILNVMRAKAARALTSEEVKGILVGIGYNPKNADPCANLRGKVMLLADPDPDGNHINLLLLTLFAKFLPEMFDLGLIYIVAAPEYTVSVNGTRYYGKSVEDLMSKLPKGTKQPKDILHIKGWGEIEPEVLAEIAFDPNTRRLYQVKGVESDDMGEFVKLMSENVEYRKRLLGIDFDIGDATNDDDEGDEDAGDKEEKPKANNSGRQQAGKNAKAPVRKSTGTRVKRRAA